MSKVFFSLFVALSFFALLGVEAQTTYTIPALPVSFDTLDISLETSGTLCDLSDPSQFATCGQIKTRYIKAKDYVYFLGDSYRTISGRDFPRGDVVYRGDTKTLYYYNSSHHNPLDVGPFFCKNMGTTTPSAVFATYGDYIDLAYSVRGKAIFTEKTSTITMFGQADVYSKTDEIPIQGSTKYDKFKVVESYTVASGTTPFCLSRASTYYRHVKGGDYETIVYGTESLTANPLSAKYLDDETLLMLNSDVAAGNGYSYGAVIAAFSPFLAYEPDDGALACPEVDNLPLPPLSYFLTSNYTEYEFILENPVHTERLVEDTVEILNLTQSGPFGVGFDRINKVKDKWSVDMVVPTKLGPALATAIENGDIKKSGYGVIPKVEKMVEKKLGK